MKEKDRFEIMFEQILHEPQAVRELVADVPEMKDSIAVIKTDVRDIKDDLASLKVIAHDHEIRVTKLESDPQAV